jgi:two-component system sensor histidine kinase GlrK
VSRILDLSRMEAKMMEYRFSRCSLMPVIQHTVLKLAPIADSKHIQLELEPLPNLPPVRIDEERIGQVLDNLTGNAPKFTDQGGRVTVKAVLLDNDKQTICVSVADTGTGITAENLHRIFNRFQRIESGDRSIMGSGLGLTIAKYIITDHGGKIWAKSTAGKGSTFYFALPVV